MLIRVFNWNKKAIRALFLEKNPNEARFHAKSDYKFPFFYGCGNIYK